MGKADDDDEDVVVVEPDAIGDGAPEAPGAEKRESTKTRGEEAEFPAEVEKEYDGILNSLKVNSFLISYVSSSLISFIKVGQSTRSTTPNDLFA